MCSESSTEWSVEGFIHDTLGDEKGDTRFEVADIPLPGDVTLHLLHTTKGIQVDMENMDHDNTGMKIWPVAREFCEYLHTQRERLSGRNILELGAGTGMCGLYTSHLCRRVMITDGDDAVVSIVKKNVELNGLKNVLVEKLWWGDHLSTERLLRENSEGYDVIIGSEILYHESHAPSLVQTVNQLLSSKGGLFIMAIAVRIRSVLNTLIQLTSNSGWKQIATDYSLTNTPRSANFSFRTLLVWEVPSGCDVREKERRESEVKIDPEEQLEGDCKLS
ncbi:putative nicotinamide N-methyltransferase-like [Planoprotostelium fungivorum]|uniref:Putative nicotinamide N-methyltransferase-like n=1 Tax=Planoprotostelium fungivorum TaxID=1890364 RepID=A0A2P6NL08_9EUKA|nr:putative nicotinamide N-methyltransferase-like [Planoprotostelium fungivorum]